MKRLLSIFNFDTLDCAGVRLPKAVVLAVALFLVVELLARIAVSTGRLHDDPTLYRHVSEQRTAVEAGPPIWFLGNSTLEAGLIPAEFTQRTSASPTLLSHGSATVRATVGMLDFYLQNASVPPREIVLFLTKDDFNLNGYRAEISKGYIASKISFDWLNILALSAARENIREMLIADLRRLYHLVRYAKTPTNEAPVSAKPNEREAIEGDALWYENLAKDFEIDKSVFEELDRVARRNQVASVRIVLMPVSRWYTQFHDDRVESPTHNEVRAFVARQCQSLGFALYDDAGPFEDAKFFEDPCHLNEEGGRWFTKRFARTWNQQHGGD